MSTERTCHELLVALAGRLPDETLWRLRDWLASGGQASIAAVLPRELLRHRIGLTDDEREMLAASVGEWGASSRLLDAILPAREAATSSARFLPDPEIDAAALSVMAVVRSASGCVELRQAWRDGQRVLLVVGADQPWLLAGTIQRILRAHGDRTPCVEVLPPHGDSEGYHGAAIIGSAALWRSPAMVGT